jgi:hypothetical protein
MWHLTPQTFKLLQFDHSKFFSQNVSTTYFISKKKNPKKKKEKKYVGVAKPPYRRWLATPFGLGVVQLPQADRLGVGEPPP